MSAKRPFTDISRETIRRLFGAPGYQPMTAPELAVALNLHRHARHKLALLLNTMAAEGEVVTIRKNRYALGQAADLVSGRIDVRRSGDGFIDSAAATQPTVRVHREDMATALPGDQVLVRLDPARPHEGGGLRSGKVVRVLQRAKRMIVGTLKSTGSFLSVVPLDAAYQKDFYVPDVAGAEVGDRVVVQFTAWNDQHVNPEGEIIEVLGPADNPSLDTLAVIRHHNLQEVLPAEVVREAEEVGALLDNPGPREDLRNHFIFTVDPATARDFDDAISLLADPQGRRVLGVHIADVSHFVRPGSALDQEAARRGNSVYLPDRVLPMLPEQLSNGVCSLNPNQDRLTFSVFITFDQHARPVAARCAKTIIRSRLRLTYEQAMAVITSRPGMRCQVPGIDAQSMSLIHAVNDLAQQLRRNRWAQHALDLDIPEYEVVIGSDGRITDIRRSESDMSHQMIEECMVAANEAVDNDLQQRRYPSLHRLHAPPDINRIEELTGELREMGFRPGDLTQRRQMAEFLVAARRSPLGHDAQIAVLRSMKRAVYSAAEDGHFGLAKRHYTHFTSPIRRYPDLLVHRILHAALGHRKPPYGVDDLALRAQHCSHTEQVAEQAERDIIEIKKYRFLEQQLADEGRPVYDAVVVKTTNFGMFVQLDRLEVQGLVHISAISNTFVRYDPGQRCLRAGNMLFKSGSRLKVVITGVDFENRRIDLRPEAARHDPGVKPGANRRPRRR